MMDNTKSRVVIGTHGMIEVKLKLGYQNARLVINMYQMINNLNNKSSTLDFLITQTCRTNK